MYDVNNYVCYWYGFRWSYDVGIKLCKLCDIVFILRSVVFRCGNWKIVIRFNYGSVFDVVW